MPKWKLKSGPGPRLKTSEQGAPLHALPSIDGKILEAGVKGFTPRVANADEAAVPFGTVTDGDDNAAVRGNDFFVRRHLKVDAVVPEERFVARNKAPVVLWPGTPLLNDAALAFKWRCQVDAFRFIVAVFDSAVDKVK